jgi:hypothetical protein
MLAVLLADTPIGIASQTFGSLLRRATRRAA